MGIAVTSDGSTAAQQGGAGHVAHRADSGERGSALMIAVKPPAAEGQPAEKPRMINKQVGKFNDTGAVDTSYLVTSNSPNLQALAIAYNFAAFNGKIDEFEKQLAASG